MELIERSRLEIAVIMLADEIKRRDYILAQLTEILSLWREEFLPLKIDGTGHLPSACRTMCRSGWLTIAIKHLHDYLIFNRIQLEDVAIPVARILALLPRLRPYHIYAPSPYDRLNDKTSQDIQVEQVVASLSQLQLDQKPDFDAYRECVTLTKILSQQWSDKPEDRVTSELLCIAALNEPNMGAHLDSWIMWFYAMRVKYTITGQKRYYVTEVDIAEKSGRTHGSVRQHKIKFDQEYWQFRKAIEVVKALYNSA